MPPNKEKPLKDAGGDTIPQMPFDEAIKRMLSAPRQHRTAKNQPKPQKSSSK